MLKNNAASEAVLRPAEAQAKGREARSGCMQCRKESVIKILKWHKNIYSRTDVNTKIGCI